MLVAFVPWHRATAQQTGGGGTAVQQPPGSANPAQNLSSSLGVFVYPANNQSAEKQRHDESDCYAWAKQQTGIDPIAGIKVDTAAQQQQQGGAVRGAARGAAAGALIGAAAGDAGTGAAVGAAAGGVGGRAGQRRANEEQQQQQQQQAQQNVANQKATFNKAFSACMQPKGYTIN